MWLKLDDTYADHPKVEEALTIAGPGAVLLHVRLMCYCAKHLTDGFVPIRATKRLASDAGKGTLPALVRSGLLVPKEGGYELPDWLDYNPSRASVERKRERDRKRLARDSRTDSARADDDPPANRSVPSRPVPSPSERSDKGDPSGQSENARSGPEENPHQPSEQQPAELRTVSDPPAEAVAKAGAILDQARGAPAENKPPRRVIERLTDRARRLGVGAVLSAAKAYAADEHVSTAGKSLGQLDAEWDKWSAEARKGVAPRGEVAKTLRLGSQGREEKPLTPAELKLKAEIEAKLAASGCATNFAEGRT